MYYPSLSYLTVVGHVYATLCACIDCLNTGASPLNGLTHRIHPILQGMLRLLGGATDACQLPKLLLGKQ
ncbi:hypothetical protein [Coraliomargarita akajimensis]|uniref:Uncharacterized protein n=1 Tax=Coraliomargarita akajimensis (strain DSM 45221 / IAM 15411 / JCM 23193 / KCTC 12865 / 04OKA010-24) TaxID=583355 RepID=D5EPP4_CORAD|nr:hypothetical protein [Coraliomargarita akajimensis]ADE53781.1 hypothetical protein Caka_0757 [Coraliomargarita akajimensis DSM 45221]